MIAGPNGVGKSTLYKTRIAPKLAASFINVGDIQRDELADTDVEAAYEAAHIAAGRRNKYLEDRKSFVAESVFSHPSKLELIKEAKEIGYHVMVLHVCVEAPDLSVARVAERVKEGGHDVFEKIRERFERNGALIRQAVILSDVVHKGRKREDILDHTISEVVSLVSGAHFHTLGIRIKTKSILLSKTGVVRLLALRSNHPRQYPPMTSRVCENSRKLVEIGSFRGLFFMIMIKWFPFPTTCSRHPSPACGRRKESER